MGAAKVKMKLTPAKVNFEIKAELGKNRFSYWVSFDLLKLMLELSLAIVDTLSLILDN